MNSVLATVVDGLRVDSIWSIVARAVVWLIFVSIFAIGVSQGKKQSRIKAEAGFFIAFLILSGITIYLTFGFVPTLTTPGKDQPNTP